MVHISAKENIFLSSLAIFISHQHTHCFTVSNKLLVGYLRDLKKSPPEVREEQYAVFA